MPIWRDRSRAGAKGTHRESILFCVKPRHHLVNSLTLNITAQNWYNRTHIISHKDTTRVKSSNEHIEVQRISFWKTQWKPDIFWQDAIVILGEFTKVKTMNLLSGFLSDKQVCIFCWKLLLQVPFNQLYSFGFWSWWQYSNCRELDTEQSAYKFDGRY